MTENTVTPFAFEALPVRGALVCLTSTWRRMQRDHQYGDLLTETLGQAAAATALIAQSLKFDGSITLQIQSTGALQMLVMQCTDDLDMRGTASVRPDESAIDFESLTRGANCAITIDTGDKPYQGIVAIEESTLSGSLAHYFARSVQVPSHLALVANRDLAAGLLLQQMPGETVDVDDWRRLGFIVQTLSLTDFGASNHLDLLHKLFSEDDVRVYEPRHARFACRCSQQKVEDVIRMLGQSEADAALAADGDIDITCEYCGASRRFDAVDVAKLFRDNAVRGPRSVQ